MDDVSGFLSQEEGKCLSCGTKGIILSRTAKYKSLKKPVEWTKHPDLIIFFRKPGEKAIPRIVFEVGFSQLYEDLISDAGQWLE